jgi:hypothetical protein
MADSIVGGLFGVSPDMYSQARNARDYAQVLNIGSRYSAPGTMMSPSLGPLYAQAAQTGQLLGQGVGGLLGVEDPELKKITAIQELSSQFDLTSPTGMRDFARSLQQVAPQEAMMAAKRADEMDVSRATVEQKTREKQGASYRTLTPAEARARGLSPSASYQVEEGTNKVTQIGQGPAVVFNAPLVGAEKKYASDIGESAAKRDISQFGAAEAAVENLGKINETLDQLKTGTAITGAFAEVQKNIQKVQAKFAADKKAGKAVSDTEYLDALLGSEVFPMISSLGIGARGLDTPAEREFLRQVMTGTVSLEKDTLVKLTEQRKRIAERAIDKFNERVDKGELNKFFEYQQQAPRKFEKPAPSREFASDYAKYQAKYGAKAVSYDDYVKERKGR